MTLLCKLFETSIRRIRRNRLRRMMRGYRNLRKSGRLSSIYALKHQLTTVNHDIDKRTLSASIFGAGLESANLIIRQYLLLRVGGLNLNHALLHSAAKRDGKVVFSMPSQWFDIIEEYGFKVNRCASSVLWILYVAAAYSHGILCVGKIVFISLFFRSAARRNSIPKPYAYFSDLTASNLPSASFVAEYNIVSWYLQWRGRKYHIKGLHHSVRDTGRKRFGDSLLIEQDGPLPMLATKSELVSYSAWALPALAIAAIDALRGRWWHALLLHQAALASLARIVPSKFLATEFLFHNSSWIFRPIWTYEVERRRSTIIFYFYSTNCEGFARTDGSPPLCFGWEAMNWPRYLVWDKGQKDFLRRMVGIEANIDIVGPIWFSGSAARIHHLPPNTLAVFDVQPVRDSFYQSLALDYDYYIPRIAIQFLSDINNAVASVNYVMAHKRKREISNLSHPHYRSALKRLDSLSNYCSVDSSLPAQTLIDKCDAVISMPYTSTALLGREVNKPSIYYDPFGSLHRKDPAAHGIPIIQGQEELSQWISMIHKASQL